MNDDCEYDEAGHESHHLLDVEDGHLRVRLLAEKCSTCIFRAGNKMDLHPGRVQQMVLECLARDSFVVCHSTLSGMSGAQNAICRGYYDGYKDRSRLLMDVEHMMGFKQVPADEVKWKK